MIWNNLWNFGSNICQDCFLIQHTVLLHDGAWVNTKGPSTMVKLVAKPFIGDHVIKGRRGEFSKLGTKFILWHGFLKFQKNI